MAWRIWTHASTTMLAREHCGYGAGLMTGRMGDSGQAIGHSGGGPFSVNAVYHFPDRGIPITVACFTDGADEGRAEFAAAGLALTHGQ